MLDKFRTYKPKHKYIIPHEARQSSWRFPELDLPDLSNEVVTGQHKAMELLGSFTVAEVFSEDSVIQSKVFGPETD